MQDAQAVSVAVVERQEISLDQFHAKGDASAVIQIRTIAENQGNQGFTVAQPGPAQQPLAGGPVMRPGDFRFLRPVAPGFQQLRGKFGMDFAAEGARLRFDADAVGADDELRQAVESALDQVMVLVEVAGVLP